MTAVESFTICFEKWKKSQSRYEIADSEIAEILVGLMGSNVLVPIYKHLNIETIRLPWTFQNLRVFDIRSLVQNQLGFRFVLNSQQVTELDKDWPISFFAIGAHVTDPIVIDTATPKFSVYRGSTGQPGRFIKLCSSLEDYFSTLQIWIENVLVKNNGKFYGLDDAPDSNLISTLRQLTEPYLSSGAFEAWLNE